MKFQFHKKHMLYLIPMVIVSLVMLAVYFVKGIYPFGSLTIIYGDMGQSYIPLCYHLYDIIYNGKSLFWDPLLGTGSNIFGVEAFSGLFSPISWLVFFSDRENIPYFAGILLIIRMALMSLTSLIFIGKTFKSILIFWKVAISVMYAFSGYVLIYYTNMMWLDCAILLPLLFLTMKNLLDKDKLLGYILVLSANLVINFYISYMIMLFIFFSSGVLLIYYVDRLRRKKALFSLAIGTVTALLVTSFVTIPSYLQSSSSIRGGGFVYENLINVGMSPIFNKAIFFIFASIPLVIFIKMVMSCNTDKKAITGFVLLIFLTTSQIIVESINLIWHTGSYMLFPLRFAFIPNYILLTVTAYYFSKKDAIKEFKSYASQGVFGAISIAIYTYAVNYGYTFGEKINISRPAFGISVELTKMFFITTLLFGISLWIMLKFRGTRIKYYFIGTVLLVEIFTHSMWYIGVPPAFRGGSEHSDDWIFTANGIKKDFDIKSNYISRYKDVDSVLNSNYPLVIGTPAVSTWIHMIDKKQQTAFRQIGNTIVYTRILDTGGTQFSDMIMNVDYFLTKTPMDNIVYDLIGQSKELYLYRNKYGLPFGIVMPNSQSSLNFEVNSNPFDNQNFMYRILFGKNENIIDVLQETPRGGNVDFIWNESGLSCVRKNKNVQGVLEYNIEIPGKQFLYLSAYDLSAPVSFEVNGKPLGVPTLGNDQNLAYPAVFNSGLQNLGLFDNETVNVKILLKNDMIFGSLDIGKLPVEKLKELAADYSSVYNDIKISGNKVTVKVNNNQTGNTLFLPLNYDESWECRLNGNVVPVGKAFSTFLNVRLTQGENNIVLSFIPKGFKLGLLICGLTLLLWLAGYLISKSFKFYENKIIINSTYFIFWPVYFAGILFVYIIPIISLVIKSIK